MEWILENCVRDFFWKQQRNDEPVRVPPYWSRSMFHVQGVANGPSKTLGLANGKRKKLNFCRVYSFIFAVCRKRQAQPLY